MDGIEESVNLVAAICSIVSLGLTLKALKDAKKVRDATEKIQNDWIVKIRNEKNRVSYMELQERAGEVSQLMSKRISGVALVEREMNDISNFQSLLNEVSRKTDDSELKKLDSHLRTSLSLYGKNLISLDYDIEIHKIKAEIDEAKSIAAKNIEEIDIHR